MNGSYPRMNNGRPGMNSRRRQRRGPFRPSTVADERLLSDEHPCSKLLTLRVTEERKRISSVTIYRGLPVDTQRVTAGASRWPSNPRQRRRADIGCCRPLPPWLPDGGV